MTRSRLSLVLAMFLATSCQRGYGKIVLLNQDARHFGLDSPGPYPEQPRAQIPDSVKARAERWAEAGADPQCNRYFSVDTFYIVLSVIRCERGGLEVEDGRGLAIWTRSGHAQGESPYGLTSHYSDLVPAGRKPSGAPSRWWQF
jgi:hypothetical protein